MNIWNAEKAFSGTSINTICATIRIMGAIDIAALQKSLDAVVKSDEQLRARITVVNGKPCQYIAPYEHSLFPVFDFTKTDSMGLSHWEDTVAREAMRLIDAPLYDFRIFRQNESEGGIVVKTHHIISDGWSQMLASNRIAETYLALISGREAQVEVGPSYRLHVEKEEKYLSSNAHEKDVAFWKERLGAFDGASSVKDCLSAMVSPVGRRKTYRLSHMLNHLIHGFCEKYRVAPFAVYYMALAIYLNRTNSAAHSSIGVPVYNRADFQDKSTLGMFVSTLPFIGEIDENWSFAQFNTELAGQWFELLRHQRLPFTEILELSKTINPDSGALFHIVLSYQTSRMYRSEDASVTFSGRWHYSGYQSEHLLIHLSSMEDDFRFSVDYDYLTQIFSERDIDRLHEYLTNILTAALSEPDIPTWRLPVIGLEEKGRVLFGFNQTARPLPYADVPSMLRAAAREHAQRVAVIAGGKRTTYGALFALAYSYARALDAVCPGGNRPVAICLEKGAPLAACVIAAALSGNTWLTLPVDTPPGRLNEILEDSGAAALVCEAKNVPPGCRVPVLEPERARMYDGSHYPPKPCAHTAYMVYTSGSTGKPKGVLIGQENLVNLAMAARKLYGHGAVLSLCSAGFDVFVMECTVSLMNGRTIIFPSASQQEDPSALAQLIRDYAVGNMSLPPSRLEAFMHNRDFAYALAGVESIVCGGEHFPGELMQALRQYTDASVYNQYGPSETTIAVSGKLLNDACAITIGGPMDNCRLYVLDAHLQPLPVGVYGELYIGGLCVGQGYRNLPELTSERFIPSPFELGETLYRTGDIGCWTNDGEIMLGGRRDDQVKLRGLRIEPQEIAMRLAAYEKIRQAAVKVISRGKSAFIAAYYTAAEPIPDAELTAFLRSYLPSYMLPGAYMRIETMPVTRSGKIDYLSLPDPEISAGNARARDDTEVAILEIFQRTLNHPDMDVESDYFLSGGDSLTAMEAIVAIEATLGAKLAVADLYAYRTARKIASSVVRPGAQPFAEKREQIPVAEKRSLYPATPTQVSLYFESQMHPASLAYNMPGAFKLPRSADKARLLVAFRELVAREKILRTSFELNGSGLVQHVWENAAFGMEELSASDFAQAAKDFMRPFDVTRPPLMRAAFWSSPEGDVYLFFDTHHLVGDGLTSPLLMKKLDGIYAGRPYGTDLGFCDYAAWQARKETDRTALSYWKDKLSNAPALIDIPYDRTEAGTGPYEGKKIRFALPGDVCAKADRYCAGNAVSPFMLFLSAFALFLNKLTGEEDMLIGTPVSGRTSKELWDVCGPFIRTLPMRVKLAREDTVARLVQNVRAQTLSVLENQEVSFDQLMRFARGEAGGRIFNTLFSMRPVGDGDFSFLGEKMHPIPADTGFVKFPLSVEAAKTEEGYSFTMEYASGMIDDDTAALWARSYAAVLGNMIEADTALLADVDSVSLQDRHALFDQSDGLGVPFADVPLDHTIDEAARRAPNAPALRFHGQTTTYAALLARAERIAKALVNLGAARGDVIGLVHARTPDMIASLIGIMKAGCAYMPALATYPIQRLAYMAETAAAKLILADDEAARALSDAGLPCPVHAVDDLPEAPEVKLPTLAERSGEDGVYVLFTSGTTGRPKGSLNKHSSIANLLAVMTPVLGAETENVLCSTNAVFDIFMSEALLPLALGKCVVLADEEEMLLPHTLARLIADEKAGAMQLTPSRLRMCMGHEAFRTAIAGLGSMLVAGEPLPPALCAWFHAHSGARLYNLYGPTEASVYATMTECPAGLPKITIGKPLHNCRVYVLDEKLRRVMPTARGELYIAGVCLAKGYINRPELTDAAFLADPFFPGQRMYKSGDIGRLLPDGNIEYLGRRDSQIKINGQRVELNEVTARLLETPGVAEAVTVAVTSESGEKHLRSCVVPASGSAASEASLRDTLRAALPPFMVPGEIWLLSAMPRNASGKTDVLAISKASSPASFGERGSSAQPVRHSDASHESAEENGPSVAQQPPEHAVGAIPVADAGATVLEIWKQVLGREEIDPRASFFEQGGGSLSALDALSRCYNAGLNITLSQFYANPTVEAQQALLGGGHAQPAAQQPEPPVRKAPARGPAATVGGIYKPAEGPASGAVLLTGATGFLGAHLLDELARNRKRDTVCVIRGGDPDRLSKVMAEYFGEGWYEANAARVRVVAGDMEQPDLGIGEAELSGLIGKTGTLIHCAADVRHFVADADASIRANAGGTANAVRLAAKLGASLAHISTMSVMGDARTEPFDEESEPADPACDANIYVKGKCAAELLVRRCAKLLPGARIFRTGRLVGRNSDGVFQKNKAENAFYRFVRGALMLDEYPESMADLPMEITPVDECARAIVLLLEGKADVYHIFDPVLIPFSELVRTLKDGEAPFVPDAEFDGYLTRLMKRTPSNELVTIREIWNASRGGASGMALAIAGRTCAELCEKGFVWQRAEIRTALREFTTD